MMSHPKDKYVFDYVIVGGGVIGLAIARILSKNRLRVIVLDKEDQLLLHTSSRNSEVLHSGLYYSDAPIKQTLCMRGQKMLYEYLPKKQIPFVRCGKVVFAKTHSELAKLATLKQHAEDHGVEISENSDQEKWPDDLGSKPLDSFFVSNTGIFDSHLFAKSLEYEFLDNDGIIALGVNIEKINISSRYVELICSQSNNRFVVSSGRLVIAAGQASLDLLKQIDAEKYACYQNNYVKGHYFSYSKKLNLQHLYYPTPTKDGLGVHLTQDLAGAVRFGPDTQHTSDAEEYSPSVSKAKFVKQVKRNFENLNAKDLYFAYSGIRPKFSISGKRYCDFKFESDADEKIISLLGIDSPGLTSSLSLAENICSMIDINVNAD